MRAEITLLLEVAGIPCRSVGVFVWATPWTLRFLRAGEVTFSSFEAAHIPVLSPEHALSLILEAQSCSKS
jgi:hypothetical protein